MYSTEQLLGMLEEKLKDYERDLQALEDNANKSVNPSKYRETIEYKKRRDKIDAKIAYIKSVISTVESKKNDLESIGSSILDKQIEKSRIAMSTASNKKLERLKKKIGRIEKIQRKIASIKYNFINLRIKRDAAIMSQKKKIENQMEKIGNPHQGSDERVKNYEAYVSALKEKK